MSQDRWTVERVPDLTGATMVVTGANSGIGFEAARILATQGARVLLACRSVERAEQAAARIRAAAPGAAVEVVGLDLADLASIRRAADEISGRVERLDVLANNAGVMALPERKTADGFEMQLGTNHLGHFALTGHLIELLCAAPAARVVTVSSGAHAYGRMRFDDLMFERGYHRWWAYCQSKLANLLFTLELERRLRARDTRAIAVACHPGAASTNLGVAGPVLEGSKVKEVVARVVTPIVGQSAVMGALPTVLAAADPDVRGGDYYGPTGFMGMRGRPGKAPRARRARDQETALRLWACSEELTGVSYLG